MSWFRITATVDDVPALSSVGRKLALRNPDTDISYSRVHIRSYRVVSPLTQRTALAVPSVNFDVEFYRANQPSWTAPEHGDLVLRDLGNNLLTLATVDLRYEDGPDLWLRIKNAAATKADFNVELAIEPIANEDGSGSGSSAGGGNSLRWL